MSRPGIEPGPPAWEASALEKSHLDSLFAGYSEPLLGLRWRSARGLYTHYYLVSYLVLPKFRPVGTSVHRSMWGGGGQVSPEYTHPGNMNNP
jgi:hypothetical protein